MNWKELGGGPGGSKTLYTRTEPYIYQSITQPYNMGIKEWGSFFVIKLSLIQASCLLPLKLVNGRILCIILDSQANQCYLFLNTVITRKF